MRRAVAFCQNIAVSKKITAIFNTATDAYISSLPSEKRKKWFLWIQGILTAQCLHLNGMNYWAG